MIHITLGRPVPIELTADPRVERRVRRLAVISVIALGLVLGLAAASLDVPAAIVGMLAFGWILMPTILLWSLVEPGARYLLVVPASLVTIGLVAISWGWLPSSPVAAVGWLLITTGVSLGGLLGFWFWFRVAPVPAELDDPYAPGRWALIRLHVALVVIGLTFAASALV